MAKQSKAQKDTMERVMHEFKEGELETGTGRKVKSRGQAVAIRVAAWQRHSWARLRAPLAVARRRLATGGGAFLLSLTALRDAALGAGGARVGHPAGRRRPFARGGEQGAVDLAPHRRRQSVPLFVTASRADAASALVCRERLCHGLSRPFLTSLPDRDVHGAEPAEH